MKNWIEELRKLPLERVDVQHEPMTARYFKAIDKRKMVIKWGEFLGVRETAHPQFWEVALWLPSENRKKSGLYCCFRLIYSLEMNIVSAILFCFYDGTEKSPAFFNRASAEDFARKEGFL